MVQGHTIDWESIHRRLANAAAVITGADGNDPDTVARILESRAQQAARLPAAVDSRPRIEVLLFVLAGETYGIETPYVREVCQLKDLAPLPCTPAFLAGVVNLRGRIVAVADLRMLFDLPAGGLTELNRLVILGDGEHEVALLADAVTGVRTMVASEVQAALPTLIGVRETFLVGVTADAVAVLDGHALLSDASLKVNEDGNEHSR